MHRIRPRYNILTRIADEHRAEKHQGQQGEKRTKEEPADEEFFDAVGITGNAQEQRRELQEIKSRKESAQKGFLDHGLKDGVNSVSENKKDGEMTDTARPAQTGQYRSVSPSSAHLMDWAGGMLFNIVQFRKNFLSRLFLPNSPTSQVRFDAMDSGRPQKLGFAKA